MVINIIIILLILWLLGLLRIPWLPFTDITVFRLGKWNVSLIEIALIVILIWGVEKLPSPFRQILYVLIVLWLLVKLGILAVSGASNLILLAIIFGFLLSGGKK